MPNYTEQQRGRVLRGGVRRTSAVQTPRGGSYITDFESSPVLAYAVSVNQSRPIHDDFDSSFAYNLFLNSKYKHHHKCATCLSVFRCGKPKCDRTLCKLCDLRNALTQTVPAPWTSGEPVRISFNGSSGASWTNIGTGHEVIVAYDEAAPHTAQDQVFSVDYEAVERQLINEETATHS